MSHEAISVCFCTRTVWKDFGLGLRNLLTAGETSVCAGFGQSDAKGLVCATFRHLGFSSARELRPDMDKCGFVCKKPLNWCFNCMFS